MRFCVIGPTYPYRGGIAHYTTLLVRYLRHSHWVDLLSYLRQYPRWLYPGNTEKDPSCDALQEDCAYLLDPLGPLSWWKAFRRIRSNRVDVLVLQWWTPFWTPMLLALTGWVKRSLKTKILFICHHVVPPEGGPFDLLLARFVLERSDLFLVHNEHDYARIREILPHKVVRLVPLPTLDMFNHTPMHVHDARKHLGLDLDVPVILFFGFVRRYKGLEYLIDAMPSVLERCQVRLLIVGEFWEDVRVYQNQIARLGLEDCVLLIPRYIPNEEVTFYFSATDLVVLPYLETATSAVVHLAFGFDKPVIGTTMGGLREVVMDGETGYLVPPGNSLALAEAIVRFLEENAGPRFSARIAQERKERSWDKLARLIEQMVSDS